MCRVAGGLQEVYRLVLFKKKLIIKEVKKHSLSPPVLKCATYRAGSHVCGVLKKRSLSFFRVPPIVGEAFSKERIIGYPATSVASK